MKLAILIPAHNEAESIGDLICALKKKGLEALIVNDGSTDKTESIALENSVKVLSHKEKMGKGLSLQEGFSYILKNHFDGVITMDGDGQHDPEDIDQFITLAKEKGVCIVSGNRMNNTKDMPFIRFCTNWFMSFVISLACKSRIPDTQCGYRYISSEILRNIDLTCNDFEIETEILMKASKKGYPVYSLPIKTIYQDEVSQINPFRDTIRFIKYFFKEIFSAT